MYAGISQSEILAADTALPVATANAARGIVEAAFTRKGGATRLAHLYQSGSLRVRFPRHDGRATEAVLINTAGGATGGDSFRVEVIARRRAGAMVTTQAAEKIYRSTGAETSVTTNLRVGCGGWLVWAPQETILFDHARLRRKLSLSIAAGGRLLACETLVFGRLARGETVRNGFLHDSWNIRHRSSLAWADVFTLDGDIQEILSRPAVADGATTLATLVLVCDDAPALLRPVRDRLTSVRGNAAATALNGVLLVRLAAKDSYAARCSMMPLLSLILRLAKIPAGLPRVWSL